MTTEILNHKTFDEPIRVMSGDTLNITYINIAGASTLLVHEIRESLVIDSVSIFKITNEFGFANGIAAILGEAFNGEAFKS